MFSLVGSDLMAGQAAKVPTVQWDTVFGTACVAIVLVAVAVRVATRASVRHPGSVQVIWEGTLAAVDRSVDRKAGWIRDRISALALTLFWFIVAANWLHLIPGIGFRAPTADLNLTLALALIVIAAVHLTALQVRGMRGYLSYYLRPWWLAPAKLLEELLKPVTLGLRLFGMAFASALMLLLIGELLPPHFAVLPHAMWTVFDLFIGGIQAYVFALLTVLYFHAALPPDANQIRVRPAHLRGGEPPR
jgi:F-type H+-transporting ATPase subunit a